MTKSAVYAVILAILPLTTAWGRADDLGVTMVRVPAGEFIMGSSPGEREKGYALDEKRKSYSARKYKWFENEDRKKVNLKTFLIDVNLVTNADYLRFVKATGHPPPYVDKKTWDSYHLAHSYAEVKRFVWQDGTYPKGRGKHPVVLVDHGDSADYCKWRGARLPTEAEWEKAGRGTDGRMFPWGNRFIPKNLNSYDSGPYDTVAVGSYPQGKSPYGVMDMAGQVFEWTSTPQPGRKGKFIVKGGSWDDYPGVTRPAAHHGRPAKQKHILIGFRCARSG